MGLDLSLSSTGVCIIEYTDNTYSIILARKIPTDKGDFKTEDLRMNHIVDVIENIILEYKVEEVVIEEQFSGPNPKITSMLNKLKGCVCRSTYLNKLDVYYITPASWRSALGQGTKLKHKEDTIEFCREHYFDMGGYKKSGVHKNEDIYDAVCICLGFLLKNNKLEFKI